MCCTCIAPFLHLTAVFNVSLELQGDCSDQLTLSCRHSNIGVPPLWIHNWTVESGDVLGTAFSGAVYTVQSTTEHITTISGMNSAQALNGFSIQCAYDYMGTLTKSNRVMYSFIPAGQSYKEMMSYVCVSTSGRNLPVAQVGADRE